jgi:hypothetical protein
VFRLILGCIRVDRSGRGLVSVDFWTRNGAWLDKWLGQLFRVEKVPDAQGYAFVFELRNPFNLLCVIGEDYSLIAIVDSRHFYYCRRVRATP